ncbi:MAG: hypothetical protein IPM53_32060 [Anaerolineaceae bacterium]|nr:hypothetical protein [Anaerolineaceae bacterium]
MDEKDLLFWSDDLQADFINEEDGKTIPDDYLFRPDERFSNEFWTIATEMTQLNDYCVLLMQETSKKLKVLKSEFGDLESGKSRLIIDEGPITGDFTAERMMMLSEEIHIWKDTYAFITRATCLLLLSAFLEKSLKTLCDSFSPSDISSFKRKNRESKPDMYLRILQTDCLVKFKESKENKSLRNKFRVIRNAFAHGDWEEVRIKVGGIHLRQSFTSVANLLSQIEEGAWLSSWGEKSEIS